MFPDMTFGAYNAYAGKAKEATNGELKKEELTNKSMTQKFKRTPVLRRHNWKIYLLDKCRFSK